jgi:catechol 2,3-dioxygenase-like lactoylglutathione lyase family enzyme
VAEEFVARVDAENLHVCIKVKDFDTALRYYHELIGLPILRRSGTENAPVFYWLPGIQLAKQTEDSGPHPYGVFDHIGLAVENIEEICARLDAAGYTAETPLGTRTIPGVARQVMNAFYRDPDGNRVEFVHWV